MVGDRCGCRLSAPRAPLLAQPREGVQHDAHLLDRVHRAAVAPVRLRQLGVPGPAVDGDDRRQRAAAAGPDLEPGRLGADARVGPHAVLHAGDAARAGRLLVGVRADDEVAAQPHAEPRQRLGGEHHAADAALHVARAAAVEVAVADLGAPRIARPAVDRRGRDDVDVAVQHQRPAAAGAGERRGELRPAGELEAGVDLARAGDVGRLRLPDVDGRAARGEAVAEVALQVGLLARRVARRCAPSCRTRPGRSRAGRGRRDPRRSRRRRASRGRSSRCELVQVAADGVADLVGVPQRPRRRDRPRWRSAIRRRASPRSCSRVCANVDAGIRASACAPGRPPDPAGAPASTASSTRPIATASSGPTVRPVSTSAAVRVADGVAQDLERRGRKRHADPELGARRSCRPTSGGSRRPGRGCSRRRSRGR